MGIRDWLPRASEKAPRKSGTNLFQLNFAQGNDRLPRRGTVEVLRAYSESPWIHTIVDRIASGVAATDWRVYRAKTKPLAKRMGRMKGLPRSREIHKLMCTGDLQEIEGHPVLDVLEFGCPPWYAGRQVVKLWQSYVELAGEGFGVVDATSKGPSALWPVPPHWMTERPAPGTKDDRFVVTIDGSAGGRKVIPREFVLWFKHADPYRPYGPGVGRSQSLGDEIDTDEAAAKTSKQAFVNGARPDILMSPKEPLSEDEVKSFLERWNQKLRGWWNANKVHVLSTAFDVHQFSASFVDMQFVELRTWERDMIMQVFGVPPEIFGNITNSNRSTIDAADYHWNSKVIVPRADEMCAILQNTLMPLFPDSENLVLGYISPVEEDREFKRSVYLGVPHMFTIDEHRALAGDEPLPKGAGELFVSGLGLVASDSPAGLGAELLERPSPFEEPEEETEDEPIEEPVAEEDEDEETEEEATDKRIRSRITKWPGTPEIMRMINGKGMFESVVPILREAVEAFGTAELEQLGLSVQFNVSHPKVQDFLQNRSAEKVQQITETTRNRIRKVLTQADADGIGASELAQRIAKVFKASRGARSLMIAQTETARAGNFGVLEGMQQGGIDEKEWLCVVGETRVAGFGVEQAARRLYSGPLVTLRTADRSVSMTPNHLVLTRRGWIPAKLVKQGDDLVRYIPSKEGRLSGLGGVPDVDHVPPTISEVFDALLNGGAAPRVVRRSVNLDGRTVDDEVEVVLVDSDLSENLEPACTESLRKFVFECSDVQLPRVLGLSSSEHRDGFLRNADPSLAESSHALSQLFSGSWLCQVCELSVSEASSDSGLLHVDELRIRETANRASLSDQGASDAGLAPACQLCDVPHGLARFVQASDLRGAHGSSRGGRLPSGLGSASALFGGLTGSAQELRLSAGSRRNAGHTDGLDDGEAGASPEPGEFFDRSTVDVLFSYESCVAVDVATRSCHVYDYSTSNAWMIAESLVIHNSTRDDKVRESHDALDGQRVPIDANFRSPITGATGPHPGEMSTAADTVGCRCVMLSVVQGQTAVGEVEEKRVKAWQAHEAMRMPYQRSMVRALRSAFTAQEQAVLKAIGD